MPASKNLHNAGRSHNDANDPYPPFSQDQLQQDARWGPNEQTPFIELGQVHGRIMDIERVQLLAILRVAFQAKARMIDGLAGSIEREERPGIKCTIGSPPAQSQ
jgi:hypothetical protein